MASKNSVNIKIAADTKEASKNIKDIKSQLDRMEKSSNSFSSRLAKLSSIASGAQMGLSVLAGAFSKVKDAVNDTIEAYKTQKTGILVIVVWILGWVIRSRVRDVNIVFVADIYDKFSYEHNSRKRDKYFHNGDYNHKNHWQHKFTSLRACRYCSGLPSVYKELFFHILLL